LKKNFQRLALRYHAELCSRLKGANRLSPGRSSSLGFSAIRADLETLELAQMHGRALLELVPDECPGPERKRIVKRASAFFLEVLAPIERTHSAAVDDAAILRRSVEMLRRRTAELAAAVKRQEREIRQRRSAETALRRSKCEQEAMLAEARNMQSLLRHLSHRVLFAQEEERKKISRQLHDEIVQALTGINVHLATLKIKAEGTASAFSRHIGYTQRLVEKSVDKVHRFARDLRPTLLDDLGLNPALHTHLKAFTKRTGLRVTFVTFAGVEKLSNEKRTVLYRVAQAALVNVAEHARASTVGVVIRKTARAVVMEVRDDGRAFDAAHVLDSRRNKRLGLIGMRERVEMVRGTFGVDSAPGRGTTISATLPFNSSPKDSP
jgi:signal transduction histidine kinase